MDGSQDREQNQAAVCSGAPPTGNRNACCSGCFWFLLSWFVPAVCPRCVLHPVIPMLPSFSTHCGASADSAPRLELHEPAIRASRSKSCRNLLSVIFHAGFRLRHTKRVPVDQASLECPLSFRFLLRMANASWISTRASQLRKAPS